MKKTVVVIIPIYKEDIDINEKKSFNQCFKVLSNYPIIFIGPDNINTEFYSDYCKDNNIKFQFKAFNSEFFLNVDQYSKLMLSIDFYKQFKNFEYMLVYQLDAYVFRDELLQWCQQGYDYIGAPWFKGYANTDKKAKLLYRAGNGGFSLRIINSFIKILNDKNKRFRNFSYFCIIYNEYNLIKAIIEYLGEKNSLLYFISEFVGNEDAFWGIKAPFYYKQFKTAPVEIAMQFSFECNPRILYNKNKNKLPFGCHAWNKYDFDFWKEFID